MSTAVLLEVTFADRVQRDVDVEPLLYGEMFEPLRDPGLFRRVTVDKVLGTVVWPNGADINPEYLRSGAAAPAGL